MLSRRFKIAALTLGGLVVLAATVDAATGADTPSMLERAACHACAFIHSLIH